MKEKRIAFFDGIVFNYFGINQDSTASADMYPTFYGVQYVSSGDLSLSIDKGRIHHLLGPVAFLTSPQHHYQYSSNLETGRKHYFVCFSGERVKRYIETGLFSVNVKSPYVKIASPDRFLNDMLELIRLLQSEENHDFAVAKLEYILLSMHNQETSEKEAGFHQSSIDALTRKIMLSPELEWDFILESAKLNISLKHFMRLFQGVNGVPPHRFVLRQRLFKAAEILIREKSSVKAAAYESGFNDEYYFSRVFKKYFQLSPDAYRNKHEYTNGPYNPSRCSPMP